ncbi:gamma-soluble NSF attachment protein-like isoform X1 [Carex littledalei]|uniref:Gamma-soluble NSF attachment protein-like isoform X1 n=1 Tax=Carex littledalei TaxID=544730 RepID=A0A833R5H6_9POAL|nr:gamma-soluble NSF attachment protein-like isoform X1 [Carex littledalei]
MSGQTYVYLIRFFDLYCSIFAPNKIRRRKNPDKERSRQLLTRHAAYRMETVAKLAKELGHLNEVADHYKRASELYMEAGRSHPASDALVQAARALENENKGCQMKQLPNF